MFDIHCSACDRRMLIFPGQITGLINDDQGIVVMYTCWCGADGAMRTGAAHTDAAGRRQTPVEHALAS